MEFISAAGVNNFEWSPDGKSIAFTSSPSKKEVTKNRKDVHDTLTYQYDADENVKLVFSPTWS